MIRDRDPSNGRMVKTDWAIRFFRHIDTSGECWEWRSTRYKNGYGAMKKDTLGRRTSLAHRLSFEIANGYEPVGKVVCHKCDNPACVRPSHLFAGSTRDNIQDMIRKGRNRPADNRGEKNPAAKLRESDVSEIKRLLASREITRKSIAERFGVSLPLVEKIRSGAVWAWVPATGSTP